MIVYYYFIFRVFKFEVIFLVVLEKLYRSLLVFIIFLGNVGAINIMGMKFCYVYLIVLKRVVSLVLI